MPGSSLSWRLRALVTAIAALLAAAGGVMAARWDQPGEVVAGAEPAPAVAEPDLSPVGAIGARIVTSLAADLPVPEPVPSDARAATPEVRHGLLEIPSIGLSQPLFEGVTLTAIDRGPSHWPGTAMPGELGNVVIAGHRTTRTRPFWDLDLVKPGDELIFTMDDGARHVYVLDRVEVVDDEAMHIVDQSYGYRATLFACHPKGSARQRIVGHFTLRSSTPAPAEAPAA
ncbi:MAG: class E sortase [Actinomycetota bacterium]